MLYQRRIHGKLAEKLAGIVFGAVRLRMSTDDGLVRAAENHHQQYMRSLRPTHKEMISLVELHCAEVLKTHKSLHPSAETKRAGIV